MRRCLPLYLLTLFLVVARSATAAGSSCPTVSSESGKRDVLIDLASGAPAEGLSFRLNDQVRLVFTNRNPFLRYDVKIEGTDQAEPALAAFANLFPSLGKLATPPPPPAPEAPPPPPPPAAPPPPPPRQQRERALNPCWTAVQLASDLLDQSRRALLDLSRSAGELNSRFMALKTAVSASQDTFNSKTATCEDLQAAGQDLSMAVDRADLDSSWRSYQYAYGNLFDAGEGDATLVGRLDHALLDADAKCSTGEPAAREQLAVIHERRSNLLNDAHLQDISKERTSLDSMIQDIATKKRQVSDILSRPENFYFTRLVGPFGGPTNVKVSVRTKKASDTDFPKDPDFSFNMNFGGPPRFTLSVGIAATRLETREYSAVQGLPLDRTGAPTSTTPTSVVGLKDNSSQRITPMLLLNTRIAQGRGIISGVHFSLGLSGKVDNLGTDVEYLAGFSFGFAENRAFLTLGAYNGRVQKLQPGFYVGSPLGNVAEPSVRKDRHWKPMVAISYKLM